MFKNLIFTTVFILLVNTVFSQNLICKEITTLKTDSSITREVEFPYLLTRQVSVDDEPQLLIWYRDFYKYLLDDMNSLNFELVNIRTNQSKLITISVDEFLNRYNLQAKYTLNDFYINNNRLYLLVYKELFEFEIIDSKAKLITSRTLDEAYQWFKISKNTCTFIRLSNTCDTCDNCFIDELELRSSSKVKKHTSFKFHGRAYLQTENSFISETKDNILIGNATMSMLYSYSKKKNKMSTIELKQNTVKSSQIDSLAFTNKTQFFSDLYKIDTSGYHYQTIYAGDNSILMGRSQNKSGTLHFLDLYTRNSGKLDSINSQIDGLYNLKNFKTYDQQVVNFTFDPTSTAQSRLMINDTLFNVNICYPFEQTQTKIQFDKKKMIEFGAEMRASKDFKYCLYKYVIE